MGTILTTIFIVIVSLGVFTDKNTNQEQVIVDSLTTTQSIMQSSIKNEQTLSSFIDDLNASFSSTYSQMEILPNVNGNYNVLSNHEDMNVQHLTNKTFKMYYWRISCNDSILMKDSVIKFTSKLTESKFYFYAYDLKAFVDNYEVLSEYRKSLENIEHIQKLKDEAERIQKLKEARYVEKLKSIPYSEYCENLILYRKLVEINPSNKKYQQKVDHYSELYNIKLEKKLKSKARRIKILKKINKRAQKIKEEESNRRYYYPLNYAYIGMSWEKLMNNAGYPDDINTTIYSWSTHKQCIYEYSNRTVYIYFEDDICVAIQK